VATDLSGGKFQNLNKLLESTGRRGFDWLLVLDDDVDLPPRFLDRFIAVCEHFDLELAQPAQSLMSHAAWRVTRRRSRSLVRETRFVEIGPVTAIHRDAFATVLPSVIPNFGRGIPAYGVGMRPMAGPLGAVRDRVVRALVLRMFGKAMLPGLNALRTDAGLPAFTSPLQPYEPPYQVIANGISANAARYLAAISRLRLFEESSRLNFTRRIAACNSSSLLLSPRISDA